MLESIKVPDTADKEKFMKAVKDYVKVFFANKRKVFNVSPI